MSPNTLPPQSSLITFDRIEWPTIVLAALVYGAFLLVTYFWSSMPIALTIVAGGWLVAWQSSLQHEVIHGHPTRNQRINDAIGLPPLSLWLPYAIYREGHLVHHRDEHLTDPIEDPESSYITRLTWERMGWSGRRLAQWNNTLIGRLTLGPLVMIMSFLVQEISLVFRGEEGRRAIWTRHVIAVGLVLAWVIGICGIPVWLYLLGFVYTGAALTRLRSFAEHRYAESHHERTAIVENSTLFGLLFLYNNLHVLHHQRPALPWYRIPRTYRKHRDVLIKINGGLVYNGYLDIGRRFLFRQHDDPRYPRHS